jgi:putative hemolysin
MKKLVLVCVIVIFFVAACAQQKISSGINPVQHSNLDTVTAIDVYDLINGGEKPILQLTDAEKLNDIVAALNANLPLTPKTFCAPRYRMVFHLHDGTTVELDYFCDGSAPFIRSELGYFENEDYAVTDAFVQIMTKELAAAERPDDSTDEEGYSPGAELANPASVFCEEQGGSVDMRQDESGGTYGVCEFDDGSECEEWELFRGECAPGE